MGELRLVVYSDADRLGGAEISVANLLCALSDRVDVTLMGAEPEVLEWVAAHRPGTPVVSTPPVRDKTDLVAMRAHRRELRRLRPDLLQVNLTTMASCQYVLAVAATIRGLPVVAVEHSPLPPPSRSGRALKRWTSSRLAAHVAVGERTAREIEAAASLPPGSVATIPNGVPDRPLAAVARYAPGPTVGTIARLDPVKGIDVLVRALARLPEVTLVVVGDGPERAALERLAVELGVGERVVWTGWLDDARGRLGAFDVFALPSRREGQGIAAVEAMLAELPVVASRVDSVPEVVEDGRTGVLVPPEDPSALAAAITGLLESPEWAVEMGRRARARARERFGPERMARRYEDLYRRLVP